MKTALVIFVLFCAGWQVDALPVLDEQEEACARELNVDRERMARFNLNFLTSPENDLEFIGFVECYSRKKELIDANGKMNFDKLLEQSVNVLKMTTDQASDLFKMSKRIMILAIDQCIRYPPQGPTPGITALRSYKCVAENMQRISEYGKSH